MRYMTGMIEYACASIDVRLQGVREKRRERLAVSDLRRVRGEGPPFDARSRAPLTS